MKINELKSLIQAAIEKAETIKTGLEGSNNPQTKELLIQKKTEIETLKAVLQAINGNAILLKIL